MLTFQPMNTIALTKPNDLIHILPLDESLIKAISHARESIKNIIQGRDSRLLVIVGPCSLHDPDATLEYAQKLQVAAKHYEKTLYIIMRAYFAKPRTTTGWKGLVYDPFLNGSHDIEHGLYLTRKTLLQINKFIPAASEFLDTITPYYFSDLISWCAIGARTCASQVHRELASSLPMPVGFKNSVDGNIQIAIHAAKSASSSHHYLGLNAKGEPAIIQTLGNAASHVILRGSSHSPNYSPYHIENTLQALSHACLAPRLIIDCSHDNCGKKYQQQAKVIQELTPYLQNYSEKSPICGIMIESNLIGGKQKMTDPAQLIYGQSITDGCLSWNDTEWLLEKMNETLHQLFLG